VQNSFKDGRKPILTAMSPTCLLTGMIAKTQQLQTANINPYTLNLASKLMDMEPIGKIVQNRFIANRPLSTLKLWGMILF